MENRFLGVTVKLEFNLILSLTENVGKGEKIVKGAKIGSLEVTCCIKVL